MVRRNPEGKGAGEKEGKGAAEIEGEDAGKRGDGGILKVESGGNLKDIDFRFPPFKKGTWRNYTTFDGLAHSSVRRCNRTPDGIFWFGTDGGVSRYDGKKFDNLTPYRAALVNSEGEEVEWELNACWLALQY